MENSQLDSIKLTQYSHGAGCGCKIAPKILDEILSRKIRDGVSGVNTNPTASRCVCLHLLTNNSKVQFEKFTGQNPVNN